LQIPNSFQEPSHAAVRDIMALPEWEGPLRSVALGAVERPSWYVQRLSERGLSVNARETTYYHLLQGDDPVLDWLRGSSLRPLLDVLDAPQQALFLDQLPGRLATAYPARPIGTVFPFRRLFVVAQKPV
jgi:trans-aconitate 2-methyltransferase